MNCLDFREHLAASIEERRPQCDVRANLSEHAEQCSEFACQQAWADFELLSAILPVWQASLPEISLEDRVIQLLRCHQTSDLVRFPLNVRSKKSRPPAPESAPVRMAVTSALVERPSQKSESGNPESRGSWMALLATVACLLLVVPFLSLGGKLSPETAQQRRVSTGGPVLSRPVDSIVVARTRPVPGFVHGYARVPQSATELVTDTMVMFLPADFSDPEDEEPSPPERWRNRLGEKLEPIGQELGTAVDAFLNAVSKTPMRST